MFIFLHEVFREVMLHMLQLLAGCLLLYVLYATGLSKFPAMKKGTFSTVFIILLSSFAGMLLPVGTYGIVPVVIGLHIAGARVSLTVPLLVSNFLFNLSVPFREMNYVWEANVLRIVIAFTAGILSGIVLSCLQINGKQLIRETSCRSLLPGQKGLTGFLRLFGSAVNSIGLYLLLGVLMSTLFSRYLFYPFLKLVYSSQAGSSAIDLFMNLDVTDPLFVTAGRIINRFMDLAALSAFLWVFRWKGVIGFYLYYCSLTILLIIPIFL